MTSPPAATTRAEANEDASRRLATQPGEVALRLHAFYGGKLQTLPKCAVRGFEDFAVWYTNQLNNSLVFPGLFRGVLDVRARAITDEMAIAVAHELAAYAEARAIRDDYILPRMDDWEAFPRVAVAAATAAQAQGVARLSKSPAELHENATRVMREAREASRLLLEAGLIRRPPDGAEACSGEAARGASG